MFRKKSTDTGSNFWISYADLMAGLLFVFILLIGAMVSKSIILKSDLHEKKERLELTAATLKNKELKLDDISATLAKNKALLEKRNIYLAQSKKEIESIKQEILLKNKNIEEGKKALNLKKDEIKKLNQILLQTNTQKDLLSKKILIVQNLLTDTNKTLNKTSMTLAQRNKMLKEYKGKVIILSNQLTKTNETVKQKDEKLLELLNALDEKETKYDALVARLQSQKAKIKSLTGIKIKVISALKDELGDKVNIDRQSGSLRLSSNILFDKGSASLKPQAEAQLKQVFEEYVGALVLNAKIKLHIDRIIVEGHTDSDGGYLYNLNLSQKRAFAVMNFLLTLDFVQKHNIKPLMIASGRAYLDAISVNGIEDKDASRRIEIKFRLKNEDAMYEIEKVLDAS